MSVPSRFAAFLFLLFLSTPAHPTSRSQIEERWPATVTGWRERDTTIPPSPRDNSRVFLHDAWLSRAGGPARWISRDADPV